jgi:hypothetical protein
LFSLAEIVTLVPLALAKANPIRVWVSPACTVVVTVEGDPDVPMFGNAIDLKAMCYPRAIAIAIALLSTSALEYTPRLLRAVLALVRSLRLAAFSDLSLFKFEKLASTSALVSGDPFTFLRVTVDIYGLC